MNPHGKSRIWWASTAPKVISAQLNTITFSQTWMRLVFRKASLIQNTPFTQPTRRKLYMPTTNTDYQTLTFRVRSIHHSSSYTASLTCCIISLRWTPKRQLKNREMQMHSNRRGPSPRLTETTAQPHTSANLLLILQRRTTVSQPIWVSGALIQCIRVQWSDLSRTFKLTKVWLSKIKKESQLQSNLMVLPQ